jgi:hypothetical protein
MPLALFTLVNFKIKSHTFVQGWSLMAVFLPIIGRTTACITILGLLVEMESC